ncbi:MAG: hypothetical protein OXC99_02375 [Chloroflexi bacterium]|nr:hypothetical protein [Chloroflexota bacterium]
MRILSRISIIAVAVGVALAVYPAAAHGFGERYDLPVPLSLYVVGAGAAVALSFVIMGVFVRGAEGGGGYPRFNLLRWRAVRFAVHPAVVTAVQAASVGVLALVIAAGLVNTWGPALESFAVAAGLSGTPEASMNISPTLVWVIWWVGMAYVSALAGNVWRLMNPWNATFAWAERAYRAISGDGELGMGLRYPASLGVWPGALAFLVFAWVEIVYIESPLPGRITQFALLYTVYMWAGMFMFGREAWLRHGDAFSLVFGFLARFSPTELRVTDDSVCEECSVDCRGEDDGCVDCAACFTAAAPEQRELNVRPYVVGLLRGEGRSTSVMVFVLLLLSTVSFDGFSATPAWGRLFNALFDVFRDANTVGTIGLLGFFTTVIAVYMTFAGLMSAASGYRLLSAEAAKFFVLPLIPIALAYHLAHFFSFLLIQGQNVIPLASDPFGLGWDIFGTAGYEIDIGIIGARTVWLLSVAAIVVGHVAAVYLAHVTALREIPERRHALRSQYPMLALMVAYTMVSLWILAQPIVESSAG